MDQTYARDSHNFNAKLKTVS